MPRPIVYIYLRVHYYVCVVIILINLPTHPHTRRQSKDDLDLRYIKQRELYTSNSCQGLQHEDGDTWSGYCADHEANPGVDSLHILQGTKVPPASTFSKSDFRELVKVMLSENMKSALSERFPQCPSSTSSDGELSPASTTAQSSASTPCSTPPSASSTLSSTCSPCATQVDSPSSGSTRMSTPQHDFISSPQEFPENFSNNSVLLTLSPPETCSYPTYPVTDLDPILHTASNVDSVPSAIFDSFLNLNFASSGTDFIPSPSSISLYNPNSTTTQVPHSAFNLEIPSSFDFSLCNITTTSSPYPPSVDSKLSPLNPISSESLVASPPRSDSNLLTNGSDSLICPRTSEYRTTDPNQDRLVSSPDLPTVTSSSLCTSHPQANLVPRSNSSTSILDSTVCNPVACLPEIGSSVQADSQRFIFSSATDNNCGFSPDLQDILQQFLS